MSDDRNPSTLVSVLMVVRNEADAIAESIASVRAQTYPHWELLVLDGGSTDATADVVRRIAADDPRVQLLDNPARVIPAGLNAGLRAARGEFVARLDGHTCWNDTYLSDALGSLEARPDAAGVGGRRYGVARTRTGRAIALALSSPLGVGNSVYHYASEAQDTDHATNGVYRAGPAREISGWDERLLVNEDVDFDHRLQLAGWALLYDPRLYTAWRVRESIPDFFRQYRRYGRGKAAMVRKNGRRAVRPRHLVAPGLVVALALSMIAGLARQPWAIVLPAVYGGAILLGAVRLTVKDPSARDLSLPLICALTSMHVGWGTGFLEGLIAGRPPAPASQREATAS